MCCRGGRLQQLPRGCEYLGVQGSLRLCSAVGVRYRRNIPFGSLQDRHHARVRPRVGQPPDRREATAPGPWVVRQGTDRIRSSREAHKRTGERLTVSGRMLLTTSK